MDYFDQLKREIVISWKKGGSLNVMDISGKTLYYQDRLTEKGKFRLTIDVSGIYFISGSNQRGVTEFKLLAY
jgi:hypothetical protein